MSDEHEHRRDSARGGSEPDDTRQFSPFDDDEPERTAPNHPDGGPRTGDPDAAAETQPVPPAGDATVVSPSSPPPSDGTAAMPPPSDGTAVMPAADRDAPESVWAGRAEVRPPRPLGPDDTAADWIPAPSEPRGRWWMPILVGFVALILLGLIIWGFYLIAQNLGDGDETPTPPATMSAPPVSVAPTATSTTTQPTTTPPTTTPATTEPTGPTEVTVPALVGLSRAEAQQALERRGLSFREILRRSDAAPGTVIDSDPAEGQQVPPDTQVTLVVAARPATTTPTAPATTTTPPGAPDED
jgi:hypothetical protein